MKERYSPPWFPFWGDKWLFGSMRIGFNTEERGIWVDLLSMGNKDNGFIRANENVPYLISQLAGLFIIPEDKLKAAIDKFVKADKITRYKSGVLYITKWEDYKLSARHVRRFKEEKSEVEDNVSAKPDTPPPTADTNINIKSNSKSKSNNKEREDLTSTEKLILNELKSVDNYPYNYLETIDYIRKLSIDFPRVDILEEVKKKVVWWIDNPLKKNSNPHLQLFNWFKIATKFRAERQENDQVGENQKPQKPGRTQEEINLIPKIEKLYKENIKKMSDKHGWKSEKDIDYMRVPFLDDFIEEKLREFRKGKEVKK